MNTRHVYTNRHHQLMQTRVEHLCPRCYHYAYHGHPRQQQVRVGNRVHHPSCAIVRGQHR